MKFVQERWKTRSFIILSLSLVACALLWTVSLTEWAVGVNTAIQEPHEEKEIPDLIKYFASFIKVLVLTFVPCGICLGVLKLIKGIKRKLKTISHRQASAK